MMLRFAIVMNEITRVLGHWFQDLQAYWASNPFTENLLLVPKPTGQLPPNCPQNLHLCWFPCCTSTKKIVSTLHKITKNI